MGFFAVWANIGVVGGVVPDAAGVDGSQGLLSVVSLKTAAGRILFEKKNCTHIIWEYCVNSILLLY